MTDLLAFALLTIIVMTAVGVGTHFGERWVDRYFRIPVRRHARDWQVAVEPMVKRCKLASAIGASVTLNGDANDAMARLLKQMAEKLDSAGVQCE